VGDGSDNSATYFVSFKWCMIIGTGKKHNFDEDDVFVECKLTKWPPYISFFLHFWVLCL
jgi:hypothetical protein